jgi:hypothetical protein
MKKILPFVIILIVGIVIGWLCRQSFIRPQTIIQRDTLVRVDTVKELYPVSIREEIMDTLRVVVRDTIRIKDTLYLSLPLEKKLYASSEYYAEVSGYRPSLDYIEVYPKTKIVKEYVNQPSESRNALSFGIEPSYLNTLSIPIYLEYGRMLHKNVEIYGQIAYDLPSKTFGAGIGIKAGIQW